MANLSSTLIHGLSSFWLRMFHDKGAVDTLFQGTEQQLGQAYLDIMEAVLGSSLDLAPAFHREYWKLIELREDQGTVVVVDGTTCVEYKLDEAVVEARLLVDRILAPTVALEVDRDFSLVRRGTAAYVRFKGGTPFDLGAPWREVGTPFGRVRLATLWAPDAKIDRNILADNFGALVQNEQVSSESYRELLKGIFQFYVRGPTLTNIEAALNLAAGYPVVRDNDETVTSLPAKGHVVTDKNIYVLAPGVRKASLIVGQVLQAFDPLTDAFTVVDAVNNPQWWTGIQIPAQALSDELDIRRQVRPSLFENAYNVPSGTSPVVCYGDPGVYYGCDETGELPPAGRKPMRHNFAYSVMERFLQHTMFGVLCKSSLVPLTMDAAYIDSLVRPGKPAGTFMYVSLVRPVVYENGQVDAIRATDSYEVRAGTARNYIDYLAATAAPPTADVTHSIPNSVGVTDTLSVFVLLE